MVSDRAYPKIVSVDFAMLPGDVKRGERFALYDYHVGELVCCMVVSSARLREKELQKVYMIPNVWITDLLNQWRSAGNRPFDPHVYELKPTSELDRRLLSIPDQGAYGGLLVRADASLSNRGIRLGAHTYQVRRTTEALADDDGGIDVYVLSDTQDPSRRIDVDVPYGTN
jgi:hypothetical protein